MPITKICKCGTEPVTSAAEGLKWAVKGCEDCKEKVTFDIKPTRPGRPK